MPTRSLTIALLHPELGFGGSERLMIDAAIELARRGHRTAIFTARFDPKHAFIDASGTDVRVRAAHVPYELAGRARVPCAMWRMASLASAARRELGPLDLVVCDLVPHAVPAIARRARAPVLFYCHYPDRLIAPSGGAAYGWYRRGIDALERRGMRAASRIVTNSRFTLAALSAAVPGLDVPIDIVNPGVDVERCADVPELSTGWAAEPEITLLSLGRFHQGKNHVLAIEMLATLRATMAPAIFARLRLVIAGGYDESRPECREVFDQLSARARERQVTGAVRLAQSPSDATRMELLARASIVLHTAPAEHFGIVPIEAMAAARPVIAVNHAGPSETIDDPVTGLLREAKADAFAEAVAQLIADPPAAVLMGQRARAHARAEFSRTKFGERLDAVVRATQST